MNEREKLVGYDFQGWPICKMNLKEILCACGATKKDGKLFFDLDDPVLNVCPTILTDDGMGYGVDDNCIVDAGRFTESNNKNEDIIYINFFREPIPTEEQQKELFERWDEDEKTVLESVKNSKELSNK